MYWIHLSYWHSTAKALRMETMLRCINLARVEHHLGPPLPKFFFQVGHAPRISKVLGSNRASVAQKIPQMGLCGSQHMQASLTPLSPIQWPVHHDATLIWWPLYQSSCTLSMATAMDWVVLWFFLFRKMHLPFWFIIHLCMLPYFRTLKKNHHYDVNVIW